ncbi:hypothetical protein EQG49_06530 [Periweissella cryptocerci]|uniref:Uncharacterized protein n=1 Tax=Periweissella cryptocerci TaxID=2506420 RepID=A0A4P6YTQ0_9LACO|nr:hypothetical protein [Periweissella cryptocerci]QBO36138.1 hypothetical protein EQG49_06530 [Periweissella cryptocerci]
MTNIKNILVNGVVYYPNNKQKLTQIDVSLDETNYPLHTKHNGKWVAFGKPKPVVGLLKFTECGIDILKSDDELFLSFKNEDIIELHVSLVSEVSGNGVPYISLPTDNYRTFIELKTLNGSYHFVNMSLILAMKLLALDVNYPVVDELGLKTKFAVATTSGELSDLVRKFGFDKLTEGTDFIERMKRIPM